MFPPSPRQDSADRDATRGLPLGGLGVVIFAATLGFALAVLAVVLLGRRMPVAAPR